MALVHIPLIPPLIVLSPQFIAESVASTRCACLMVKVWCDGAACEAAEIAIPSDARRRDVITVLEDGIPGLEVDAVVLETCGTATTCTTTAVEELAGGAAGVAMSGAGHDVSELDTAGLAVPEADADEEKYNDAADDGESDDEISIVGTVGELGIRKAVLVHADVQGG
jgi:hypothetical protein